MIADEVMCGFGRTGEWFAVNHWDVVPDLMTTAKGLTSSYLPLGAVGDHARRSPLTSRSTCSTAGSRTTRHPLACAAALAAIRVLEEDDLVGQREAAGRGDARATTRSCGEAPERRPRPQHRACSAILELVKDRETHGAAVALQRPERDDAGGRTGRSCDRGLFTMVRFNGIMTNPPLCITEEQLDEGFAIIDEVLSVADAAMG